MIIKSIRRFEAFPRNHYKVIGEENGGWWVRALIGPAGYAWFIAAEARKGYVEVPATD